MTWALEPAGANFPNDVEAANGLRIAAGNDIVFDGQADGLSDAFGSNTGQGVDLQAGGDIAISDALGGDASIQTFGTAGADVVLRSGPDALTRVATDLDALESASGDVVVNADRLDIEAGAQVLAPQGIVQLQPSSPGRPVHLGDVGDADPELEVSDAEVDRIDAQGLTAGGADAGTITVTAPITPLAAPAVRLMGSGFTGAAGGSVQATSLRLTDASAAGGTMNQTATTLNAGPGVPFAYSTPQLILDGEANDDVFNVSGTPGGTTTRINGGAGDEVVRIGSPLVWPRRDPGHGAGAGRRRKRRLARGRRCRRRQHQGHDDQR